MQYNLLTSAIDKTRAVEIPEVALLAVLGFAIVFFGIAFLIFVVWAVGKIMTKLNAGQSAVQTPKAQEIVQQPQLPATQSEDLDDETVAVIMAALMAYYQQTGAKCDFTVKRIKRI